MTMTPEQQEKVLKLAAERLATWMMRIQVAQLRLRCAEIVYTTGSQEQKIALDKEAERLYAFALGGANPSQVLKAWGIPSELDKQ